MSRYIRQYVSTCDLCLRTKPIRQALVGELYSLRIPDSQWNTLSVDFHCGTPPLLQTWHGNNSGRLGVEMGTLHSDAHNGDSRRSSPAFLTSSLETPWSSKVCSLGPWTSVHHSFHQRALPPPRNKVGIFYSLAPLNQWADRMHQPRIGPVPPAICKWVAGRLVWSLTHGGVPAQQPRPLHYPAASISTRHRTYSLHRLRTLTEPLGLRDGQWVYRKNKNSDRRSKIRDLQDTGWHEKIL